MTSYAPFLEHIDREAKEMRLLLSEWAKINTHSYHTTGLRQLASLVKAAFAPLEAEVEELELPPHETIDSRGEPCRRPLGPMLVLRKRAEAPVRILLGIHIDTVYSPDHPFRDVEILADGRLRGPGVADAKGGLAVMLKALEAFERSPFRDSVGWEIFVNPDEEIGSPGSAPVIEAMAARSHLALLFEPALQDGSLVSTRRGTGEFSLVVRGRSAHAGREPERGRNAIVALSDFILAVNGLNGTGEGVTVNVGQVKGGGPVNVVPDLAAAHFAVRVWSTQDAEMVRRRIEELCGGLNGRDGITARLSGRFSKPPKTAGPATRQLLGDIVACGGDLGTPLRWRPSSGASDGNELSALGLPTVDSLGVRGGALHSDDEFVELDSLTERARLAALYLMKLGAGELKPPGRETQP